MTITVLRRRPRRWVWAFGICVVAFVAGAVQAAGVAAQEAPEPPQGHASVFERGPVHGVLILPPASDARPLGVVVVLHDELGPDLRSTRYIDQLLGARVAVLDMQRMERDAAAFAVVAAGLAADPRTRGLRIGMLGFGGGALAASRIDGPIAARALLYPGCRGLAPPRDTAPDAVFLAHGDADAVNTPQSCAEAVSRLTSAGMTVRHRVYADAGYAWDHPVYGIEQRALVPRPDGTGRVAIAPWPELTTMAASQVAAFFSAAFQVAP